MRRGFVEESELVPYGEDLPKRVSYMQGFGKESTLHAGQTEEPTYLALNSKVKHKNKNKQSANGP